MPTVDDLIKVHEGLRLKSYWDPEGKCWTCGYGCTGGHIGPDTVWTEEIADAQFVLKRQVACGDCWVLFPIYNELDDVRAAALVDMAYNLGRTRLAQFVKLRAAVEAVDWHTAAAEVRDSLWHKQVGERGDDIANMLETGQWPAFLRDNTPEL